MTLGGRIHAVVAAFAVGYLFVGSVVVRTDGALVPSAAKVVFAVLGAWIVWAGTGRDKVHEADSGTSGQESPRIAPASQLASLGGYASPLPASPVPASPLPEESGEAISRSLVKKSVRSPVSPERLKRLSELAFANGWTVEAAYWLALAQLRGATDRAERMRDYVEAWLAMGCPDELENVHAGFSESQGSFGRSVLRFHSGNGLALAIARFSQMAHDGDENARAFLEENGIELPRKGAI